MIKFNLSTICQKLNLNERDYLDKEEFTTSIPKLIDNEIIDFINNSFNK